MKKLICFTVLLCLLAVIVSCDENDTIYQRDTNFEVPELTPANTIQFTVVAKANDYGYVNLKGGKIAVDWGDGEVTKDIEPDRGEGWRTEFSHRYRAPGEYRVKIWSEEVTFINIISLLKDYKDLHVGECPVLWYAMFNSFSEDRSLDLNGCPALEHLNLGNWAQLESVALDKCYMLNEMLVYTNPKLVDFDISKNTQLTSLKIQDCGIKELKLPQNISTVECIRNDIQSITLSDYKWLNTFDCSRSDQLEFLEITGCDKLWTLNIAGTKIKEFDFASIVDLTTLNCDSAAITVLDVSKNSGLTNLSCVNMGLTSLNVTHNPNLLLLDCGDNELTELDLSENINLRRLYINGNQFEKEALETIFKTLPQYDLQTVSRYPLWIKIYDNPGAAGCDTKILTDKYWRIAEKIQEK